MAADISIFSLTNRSTTTVAVSASNATEYFIDNITLSSPIDLGDNRSVSLALEWGSIADSFAIADVSLETSEDQVSWRECGRFKSRVTGDSSGSERIGLMADRYLRGVARIVPRSGQSTKGTVKFSVLGRAVGEKGA